MERLLAERVPFVTATVVRAAKPTSVRPGDAAIVLADGTIEASSAASARRRPSGCTPRARWRRARPCCCGCSRARATTTRRRRRGRAQPVPERRVAGDLPRPPAGRAAVADRGRDADRAGARGRRAGRRATRSPTAGSRPAAVRRRAGRGLPRRRRGGARWRARSRPAWATSRSSPAPKRGAAVLEALDVDDALRSQVHTPAGLDIGAHAPADIAISILAQMVAERTTHAPAVARDRDRPGLRHAGRRQRRDAEPLRRQRARLLLLRGLPLAPTPRSMPTRVSGLVLAAGGSSRLGQPKQLLPFGGRPCSTTPWTSRGRASSTSSSACSAAARTRCARRSICRASRSSSTTCSAAAARRRSRPRCRSSPATCWCCCSATSRAWSPASVRALLAGRGDAPLAVCRYDDGRGHPFAFARSVFGELAALHGDKGVWKLLDRGSVVDVRVPGTSRPTSTRGRTTARCRVGSSACGD